MGTSLVRIYCAPEQSLRRAPPVLPMDNVRLSSPFGHLLLVHIAFGYVMDHVHAAVSSPGNNYRYAPAFSQ